MPEKNPDPYHRVAESLEPRALPTSMALTTPMLAKCGGTHPHPDTKEAKCGSKTPFIQAVRRRRQKKIKLQEHNTSLVNTK